MPFVVFSRLVLLLFHGITLVILIYLAGDQTAVHRGDVLCPGGGVVDLLVAVDVLRRDAR